jgi:hypothetical protein
VFEEKIEKPLELYLHANSNVICMNSLNTVIANAIEKSKLGEAGFNKHDIFSSPALVEKICSDDILSLICDNSNDVFDPRPFEIPMKIVERAMKNCYLGDGTVHPGDHLLFIHELCELFKCAGLSTSQVKRKLFSLSLKGRAAEWYKTLKDGRSIGWEDIVPLFYSKFYPSSEIHKDRNYIYNFHPHDGVSRSTCSWSPSTAQLWPRRNQRPKPNKEDPHEEAPHEENDDRTAKDQKTSSRAVPHEGKDQICASSACSGVEREDKVGRWHTVHATPTRGRPTSTVPA